MRFGVHGTAHFPAIGGQPSSEANRPNYTDALALAPGHIWVSGMRGMQDYVARLRSVGRPDATFASGKAVAVGDDGFGWVASIIPRPGGGAFLLSRISGFDASPIWPVRALTSRGRSDTKWGHGGFAFAGPTRCEHALFCGASIVGGEVLADGSLRLAGSLNEVVNDGDAYTAIPIVVGFTPPAGRTPRWARTGGPGWPDPPSVGVWAAAYDRRGRIYVLGGQAQGRAATLPAPPIRRSCGPTGTACSMRRTDRGG